MSIKRVIIYDEEVIESSVQTDIDKTITVFGNSELNNLYELGTPKRLTVFGNDVIEISNQLESEKSVKAFESTHVIKLYEQGPIGPPGERGISGLGEPFYLISSNLYGTTSSLALQGFLSSSLIPYSDNYFNLGSEISQWNTLFLSGSLKLSQTTILSSISNDQQIFLIQSASVSASFTNNGIFHISEFSYLPNVIPGGIIKSGSDFYFGVT